MFSSRFHWDLRPNRLTELLAAKRSAGAAVLDLTESNPTRAGLDYPAGILEALAHPDALLYDPAPAGTERARQAVCGYYSGRGHTVDPDRILITASTSEAYAYLFKLLTNPGDEVLVPRPSYPLFEFLATMESVRVAQYPLVYHGVWSIDFPALAAAVNERTRAVILVNPNNPTGSFLKRDEQGELVRLARRYRLAIIADEVFADYAFAPDPRRVSHLGGIEETLVFSMSGLSKVAGLPQLKLGWMVIGGPPAERREAREKLEWIADTYLSVGTPVQQAAPALLDLGRGIERQIQERVRRNLAFLQSAIGRESPARILTLEGGWYATLQLPRIRREEEWALTLLDEDDVLLQPGFFYDFETEAYLVASLLTRPATFEEGIRRLCNRL
ncbi:MAG TPA: pyridoxal phosphate-dependent aminotransferase [Bryobacteraceae bacterium]|nr:pyridoxal phosphate-dependent aminotransferase [Bryobacteraceae bacterium]